jgi:SH3 domain-containing YSC84-like protein 1
VTDFVMILNDASAVRAFQQLGSITLGGNLSIAAGPIGRNAEASGAANFKAIAPVFSYSKTKGLFAGVSLEGSVLIERRDANRKFYGAPVTAKQLLTGQYPAPPAADPLYRILNTRAFSGDYAPGDSMYNDIPRYGDDEDEWEDDPQYGNRNRAASVGQANTTARSPAANETWRNNFTNEYDDLDDYDRQERSFKDNRDSVYVLLCCFLRRNFTSDYSDSPRQNRSNTMPSKFGDKPARPTAPKPVFTRKDSLGTNQYIAQFAFDGEQSGDLSFKKGDIIEVTKKSDSRNVEPV